MNLAVKTGYAWGLGVGGKQEYWGGESAEMKKKRKKLNDCGIKKIMCDMLMFMYS